MKRILALLVSGLLATQILCVSAAPPTDAKAMYISTYLSKIENVQCTAVSSVPLIDVSSDSIVADCYSLTTGGYVIIDRNNNTIYEYSISNKSPYTGKETGLYYGGPFSYFTKVDEIYVHSYDKKIKLSRNDFVQSAAEFNKYRSSINTIKSAEKMVSSATSTLGVVSAASVTSGNLSGTLSTSWVNGYCGPTSIYCVLQYKGKLRPSPASPRDEIAKIASFTGTTVSLSSLVSGTQSYLNTYKVSATVSSCSYNFNTVMSKINGNSPLTLGTSGGGLASGGHVQTIHGYQRNTLYVGDTIYTLYVNNSWGQNNVSIPYQINSSTPSVPSYLKDHVYLP